MSALKVMERQDFQEAKAQLRLSLQQRLAELSKEDQVEASARVCTRVRKHRFWQAATSVLFYAALDAEIDTWDLVNEALALGKVVAFPKYDRSRRIYTARQVVEPPVDLRLGHFGIHEPVDGCQTVLLNQLDLVLVPGLGFDQAGHRLGRGKGYYDRLLADVRGIKCGLAFECQVAIEIPAEPHDVDLDCVVTPSRWLGAT